MPVMPTRLRVYLITSPNIKEVGYIKVPQPSIKLNKSKNNKIQIRTHMLDLKSVSYGHNPLKAKMQANR